MEKLPRKHRRYPCLGVVEIKADRRDMMPLITTAMLYNISQSGMKCSSLKQLAEGTSIVIHILELMAMKVQAELRGTVIWSSKIGSLCNMGIRFTREIDHNEYPQLCELICAQDDAA